MKKQSLVEATMLALQGKLTLEESKEVKKESINVSVNDDGSTVVDTEDTTVVVMDATNETVGDAVEEIIEEPVEVVEVPVEGTETIIPEEELPIETVEEIIEEPVEDVVDEVINESIKPEDDNGDYNYFYSPKQIIEICEDKQYEHTFNEEYGTIEELEKELQGIKRIESEKPLTTIEEPLTHKYPGWKNCKVKTILKDGREFVSEEDTLSVWDAVQLVVADEVIKESWNKEIKDGLNDGWYSDGTSLYAKTRDDMLNVIDFMESEGNITKRGAELVTNKINQLSISEDKNIRIEFPEGQMLMAKMRKWLMLLRTFMI